MTQVPESTPTSVINHSDFELGATLSKTLKDAELGVAPALQHLVEQAEELARAGREALSAGSHELSERAHRVGDRTLDYIRHEPVKSVAIAAVMGAAAVAIVQLLRHPQAHR